MADHDDDYRSSDDEDYVPEGAAEEAEEDASSGDEVDEVTGTDGEIISGRRRGKQAEKPSSSSIIPVSAEAAADVDAVFAAMLAEDEHNIQKLTGDSPSSSNTNGATSCSNEATASTISSTTPVDESAEVGNETKIITEVFDFAGEEIKIEKKVTSEEYKKHEEDKKKADEKAVKRPTQKRVGLGDALTLLQKKPKMSILDKSNHDWMGFKQDNDLNEELQTFNRGKNGYLNKVDFLTRTDLRQFENEKAMRNARRKPQ